MEAIEELAQLSDSMRQASALLADEDVDETSSSRRPSTFLNVVALGNTVSVLDLLTFLCCILLFRCVRSLELVAFFIDCCLRDLCVVLFILSVIGSVMECLAQLMYLDNWSGTS